jgi:hypothetical protein
LVEGNAERVDISTMIDVFGGLCLFWGEVARCAEKRACFGVAVFLCEALGDTKIHHLGCLCASFAVEEDIGRLEVAVDNLFLVGIFDSVKDG